MGKKKGKEKKNYNENEKGKDIMRTIMRRIVGVGV